jgi:hypothetical protein
MNQLRKMAQTDALGRVRQAVLVLLNHAQDHVSYKDSFIWLRIEPLLREDTVIWGRDLGGGR